MRKLEVEIPIGWDTSRVERLIETLCKTEGLSHKTKRTLKSYSGSRHWHFKKGSEKGTLEVTLCPRESRIIFSVHDNRRGPWTQEYQCRLVGAIRKVLQSKRREEIAEKMR